MKYIVSRLRSFYLWRVLDLKYMLLNRASNKRHALLRRCDAAYAKCRDLEQDICELWDELDPRSAREG